MSLPQYVMLMLKTTSPPKLFPSDCIALYHMDNDILAALDFLQDFALKAIRFFMSYIILIKLSKTFIARYPVKYWVKSPDPADFYNVLFNHVADGIIINLNEKSTNNRHRYLAVNQPISFPRILDKKDKKMR